MFIDRAGNTWPTDLIKAVYPEQGDTFKVILKGNFELTGCIRHYRATIIPNHNSALLYVEDSEADTPTGRFLNCGPIVGWISDGGETRPFVPGATISDGYVYDARLRTLSNNSCDTQSPKDVWPHHALALEEISKKMGY